MKYQLIKSIEFPAFPVFIKLSEYKKSKKGKINIPRYIKINGQNVYNRTYNVYNQAKIIKHMSDYMTYYIKKLKIEPVEQNQYPISIEYEIHTSKYHGGYYESNGQFKLKKVLNWDIGNFWLWNKVGDDALTKNKIIIDDSIEYVVSTGKLTFVECENYNDRKLLINIFKASARSI
jgi:hypothetical protein